MGICGLNFPDLSYRTIYLFIFFYIHTTRDENVAKKVALTEAKSSAQQTYIKNINYH